MPFTIHRNDKTPRPIWCAASSARLSGESWLLLLQSWQTIILWYKGFLFVFLHFSSYNACQLCFMLALLLLRQQRCPMHVCSTSMEYWDPAEPSAPSVTKTDRKPAISEALLNFIRKCNESIAVWLHVFLILADWNVGLKRANINKHRYMLIHCMTKKQSCMLQNKSLKQNHVCCKTSHCTTNEHVHIQQSRF